MIDDGRAYVAMTNAIYDACAHYGLDEEESERVAEEMLAIFDATG